MRTHSRLTSFLYFVAAVLAVLNPIANQSRVVGARKYLGIICRIVALRSQIFNFRRTIICVHCKSNCKI